MSVEDFRADGGGDGHLQWLGLLDVETGEEGDWEARKEGWAPRPPRFTGGVLGKYAKLVQSAAHGAVTG